MRGEHRKSLEILQELEGRCWPSAGVEMQIWGPCVASRDRWLHEANHHKLRVKTPVLSEGHRWSTRSLPSQPGEEADTVTLTLA